MSLGIRKLNITPSIMIIRITYAARDKKTKYYLKHNGKMLEYNLLVA